MLCFTLGSGNYSYNKPMEGFYPTMDKYSFLFCFFTLFKCLCFFYFLLNATKNVYTKRGGIDVSCT